MTSVAETPAILDSYIATAVAASAVVRTLRRLVLHRLRRKNDDQPAHKQAGQLVLGAPAVRGLVLVFSLNMSALHSYDKEKKKLPGQNISN